MSKSPAPSTKPAAAALPRQPVTDLAKFCKSVFNLTFVIEIVGFEVFHDCNEGFLDLGPCEQGMRLQYQLYYGQNFEIDIQIWPHVAKVWCGNASGWVRTWQFLERRFLTFSISHAFPVRVMDLQYFVANVTPLPGIAALGANARNDKTAEVYLPSLVFGERRYFAPVIETHEESISTYLWNLLWDSVLVFIPSSYLDIRFDTPHKVSDVRHQDAVLFHVNHAIMNTPLTTLSDEEEEIVISKPKTRLSRDKKDLDKKKVEKPKGEKLELQLSGDSILAGVGRIVPFDSVGERSPDMGEIIILIGSNYLPAHDDLPIIFVNVETLFDVPLESLKKLNITHLYTRWSLCDEIHDSEHKELKLKKQKGIENDDRIIRINDHHAVLLDPASASKVTAHFLDDPYEIQLRGIRLSSSTKLVPTFFGYESNDKDFSYAKPAKIFVEELDILIAVTKIDSRAFSNRINAFVRGDYPLFPPKTNVAQLDRAGVCTNDINGIGKQLTPIIVVPPSVVLEAQMTLEVSLGMVGCKPRRLVMCYSRMFLLNDDSDSIMEIIKTVLDINMAHVPSDNVLTGFAIDTGNVVIFFLEGPRDGHILKVWEMTEDYYPKLKPIFSSSARFSTRVYPDLLIVPELTESIVPFVVMKMYVPLNVLLACPPVYTRPAVPLPTRAAVLKIGRLVGSRLRYPPSRAELPSSDELRSFRLELCSPLRPPIVALPEFKPEEEDPPPLTRESEPSVTLDNAQPRASMQSTVSWLDNKRY